MRALGVVVGGEAGDGFARFGEGGVVGEPDFLLLQGAEEALDVGVPVRVVVAGPLVGDLAGLQRSLESAAGHMGAVVSAQGQSGGGSLGKARQQRLIQGGQEVLAAAGEAEAIADHFPVIGVNHTEQIPQPSLPHQSLVRSARQCWSLPVASIRPRTALRFARRAFTVTRIPSSRHSRNTRLRFTRCPQRLFSHTVSRR